MSYRRIITANNAEGKSHIALDTEANNALNAGVLFDFWVSGIGSKADDPLQERAATLEPPEGGTIFRFFKIFPEDPAVSAEDMEAFVAAQFDLAGAAHCRVDTRRSPHMHLTSTIDYIILLQGKVTLLLDEDETELNPFDVVVQRQTNHAWINHGNEPALLMAVLIDDSLVK